MSASQLLRILQALPAGADDEICGIDTDELELGTVRSSRCTNPFLSNEENRKSNFWNNPELETSTFGYYIDKSRVEYELPELMVCYQESDFQVKDICIDEGVPNEVSTVCNSDFVREDGDDMIEASLDPDFLKPEWLIPSYITHSQEKMNSDDDVSTESSNNFAHDVDQQALEGCEGGKLSNERESEIHGNVAFYFDTQSSVRTSPETRYVGVRESSFSMAGVILELISCSRPITFSSGISVSNHSDSSATSTRSFASFAFPTLETDYNSSPVRMGKAETRRLRKQRGWGQCLLCCKFKLK
ncbi:hypothetical protein LXL04_023590 [Taraxacum kok-saghyz]